MVHLLESGKDPENIKIKSAVITKNGLKIINKKNPIITGGSAKGKETSRSNTKFNGVFRFTNNHPTLRAGIIFISVAIIET